MKQAVARKVSLRQDQRDKMESIRQSKPYEYLAKSGAPEAPAISFTDMGTLSDSIDNRMKYTQDMNEIYGTRAPVLRPVEVLQFTSMVDGAKPAAASAQLRVFASNMTDKQLDTIAAQVYETRPDIGMALSYSEFDPKFSEKLLNGAKVRKDGVVKMPADSKLEEKVNEIVAQAVRTPAHRKAVQQAVINAYADGVFKKEIEESDVIDGGAIETLLKERVLGEIISVGVGETIGFRREDGKFIESDDFEDAFEGMREDELVVTHGSAIYDARGKKVELEDVIDSAELIAIGDGVYRVRVNGFDFQNSAGRPFNLNMKKMTKAYEKRPQLQRGGRGGLKQRRKALEEKRAKFLEELAKMNEADK